MVAAARPRTTALAGRRALALAQKDVSPELPGAVSSAVSAQLGPDAGPWPAPGAVSPGWAGWPSRACRPLPEPPLPDPPAPPGPPPWDPPEPEPEPGPPDPDPELEASEPVLPEPPVEPDP